MPKGQIEKKLRLPLWTARYQNQIFGGSENHRYIQSY